MAARKAFQAQTATGKLKAVMTPTGPSGCHCSVHAMLGPFGLHRHAVQHARLTHGEIGHVDHFLHFAVALGLDLADFQ